MNRVTPAVTRGFVLIYLHVQQEGSAERIYSNINSQGVHDSSNCSFVRFFVCLFVYVFRLTQYFL